MRIGAAFLIPAAMDVAFYLCETDGVPIRLDRLEPAEFAAHLKAKPEQLECGLEKPRDHEWFMLRGAAMLFRRCAARGIIDEATGRRIAGELSVLAMGYAKRKDPWVA